jgi:hypothetical protein
MKTPFTVERSGRELTVTISWEVKGTLQTWNEPRPYGMRYASESMSEATVDDVELTHEEWPQGFSDGDLTPEEFKRARAEAMEKAEEAPTIASLRENEPHGLLERIAVVEAGGILVTTWGHQIPKAHSNTVKPLHPS